MTTTHVLMVFTLVIYVTQGMVLGEIRAQCSENFAPCTCTPFEDNVINVECDRVPLSEIKAMFNATYIGSSESIRFFLTLPESDDGTSLTIPADLLGFNKAQEILIRCPSRNFELEIHPDAFRISASSAKIVEIRNCLVNHLDFLFLASYEVLNDLAVLESSFPALNGLPLLPNLHRLTISSCVDFNSWNTEFYLMALQELRLEGDSLDDSSVDLILKRIMDGSETIVNTLTTLHLNNNSLTKVPNLVAEFNGLSNLKLSQNNISMITSDSLIFKAPEVYYVGLEDISLNEIELGSFGGNFGRAQVNLTSNQLTELNVDIFLRMLEDMMIDGTGFLDVSFNPIECDCDLAWLIRDNYNLVSAIVGGTCSDSTPFVELDPETFCVDVTVHSSSTVTSTSTGESTGHSSTTQSSPRTSGSPTKHSTTDAPTFNGTSTSESSSTAATTDTSTPNELSTLSTHTTTSGSRSTTASKFTFLWMVACSAFVIVFIRT